MKTTEKQENEIGPFVMKFREAQPNCFCCKNPIDVGQSYYLLNAGNYTKFRHTECPRSQRKSADDGKAGAYHKDRGGRVIRGTNSQ